MKSNVGYCLCPKEAALVKPFSLSLNISWTVVGNAVDTFAQWARVVALLHLGGEVMVGALALVFAVCTPVYGLASLGLRGAVATDAKHEYQFGDYLALRLITSALAFLVVAGIAWSTGYELETALLILLVGVTELIKAVSDVFHAIQQQNERMDRFAISLMIRCPLMVAVLVLGVWWTGSLFWGVAAMPLVALATLLWYDIPNGRRVVRALQSVQAQSPSNVPLLRRSSVGSTPKHCLPLRQAVAHSGEKCGATLHASGLMPRWDPPTMLRLAWLTLPLGVVIMLIALQVSVPRYLVSFYLGNRALGVFVSIFYLGMVGSKVVCAIGQSSGPRLAKYYAAADTDAYLKLLGQQVLFVLGLGTATVLAVMLLGGPILALIYQTHFAQYAELAVYMMLAAAVGYMAHPLGMALEAMRRFKTHMVIRAIGILVLLALAPGCIEAYGIKGAAIAIMVSCVCVVLGCTCVIILMVREFGKRNLTNC